MFFAVAFAAIEVTIAAEAPKLKTFAIPAGPAGATLTQFAAQSGEQVLYSAEVIDGLKTRPVKGAMTAREALERMLTGTDLRAVQDEKTGAFAINRIASPAEPDNSTLPRESRRAAARLTEDELRAAANDEVTQLSPFTVSVTEDRGYQAQSSLGGSRLKTSLKDIASPTTAFTEQFLLDTAITDTSDLASFMLSTEYDYGEDGGNQNNSTDNARALRMRGLKGGEVSTNFFKVGERADIFSTERIDQSRGPNSVLFGIGSPGGIINVTTKRASLKRNSLMVSVQARSHQGLREMADFNMATPGGNVAWRGAAVNTHFNSWRNHEYNDEERFFGTFKFKLGARTELNIEGETGHIDKQTQRTHTAYDAYTPWVNGGRLISATPNTAQGVQRASTAPLIVYEAGATTLMNWRNATSSRQRTSVDGDNIALTDFSVLPRETAITGPGFGQLTSYTRLSANLTHAFTRDWNMELAAIRYDKHRNFFDAQTANGRYLKVDTNPTLPTGQPNPNAGRPYLENYPHTNSTDSRDDAVRGIVSYHRNLGRWGRHTLAGVAEYAFAKSNQRLLREQIISPNAPNLTAAENNNNRVWRRNYVNLTGPSGDIILADWTKFPVNGMREVVSGQTYQTAFLPFNTNTQRNSNDGTTLIGMLQSSFWGGRIHTVVGGSRDQRTDYMSTQVRTPLAGFAQGILTAVPSRAGVTNQAYSISFSTVVHATKWLSFTYSKAENSALPSFTGRLHTPNGRPPVPRGQSDDIGFKLDLFDHRFFVTAAYYETAAKRDFDFTGVRMDALMPIWSALDAAGVLRANNLVLDQVQDRTTGSTFDSASRGTEVELTANPTKDWRLFLNYSYGTTRRTNIGQEMKDYVAANRAFWTRGDNERILLDGSGQLAPVARNGDAVIETIGERIDALDQAMFDEFVLADGKAPRGQIRHKLNFRTGYDFADGRLKGFSIGGGGRYHGKPLIRYNAFTDASGNIVKRLTYGSNQVFVDANASYRRKLLALNRPMTWTLQVNVNNVLNNDAFVRLRVSSAGELTTYRFNPPREWIVASRFAF